jgi:hypothetical protein
LQPQNIETFYAFKNEVKIAKFKSFDLNLVRKALYRLYDHSIAALRRCRDKETGLVYLQLETPTRPAGRLCPKPKVPCS